MQRKPCAQLDGDRAITDECDVVCCGGVANQVSHDVGGHALGRPRSFAHFHAGLRRRRCTDRGRFLTQRLLVPGTAVVYCGCARVAACRATASDKRVNGPPHSLSGDRFASLGTQEIPEPGKLGDATQRR